MTVIDIPQHHYLIGYIAVTRSVISNNDFPLKYQDTVWVGFA
jgi:hypothetical protein